MSVQKIESGGQSAPYDIKTGKEYNFNEPAKPSQVDTNNENYMLGYEAGYAVGFADGESQGNLNNASLKKEEKQQDMDLYAVGYGDKTQMVMGKSLVNAVEKFQKKFPNETITNVSLVGEILK